MGCARLGVPDRVRRSPAACGRSRPRDLFGAVAIGAEYAIVDWSAAEIGIDVFPHELAAGRDLEQASEIALANERVAVRQALRVRDARPGPESSRRRNVHPVRRSAWRRI